MHLFSVKNHWTLPFLLGIVFFTQGTEQLVTTTKIPKVRPMSCFFREFIMGTMVWQRGNLEEICQNMGEVSENLGIR